MKRIRKQAVINITLALVLTVLSGIIWAEEAIRPLAFAGFAVAAMLFYGASQTEE